MRNFVLRSLMRLLLPFGAVMFFISLGWVITPADRSDFMTIGAMTLAVLNINAYVFVTLYMILQSALDAKPNELGIKIK